MGFSIDEFRKPEAKVVDIYRFSESGGGMGWHRALVAVIHVEEMGYLCVHQEYTANGDAYACLRIPAGNGVPKAADYADSRLFRDWVRNEFFAPWMEADLRR